MPRAAAADGRRLAPDLPVTRGGQWSPPYWTRPAPDELERWWSSGFEFLVVQLAERGDSVTGVAKAWRDDGAGAIAPVDGRRARCPD